MKKFITLLFALLVVALISCNSGETKDVVVDSTLVSIDTCIVKPDSCMTSVDTCKKVDSIVVKK